MPFLAGELIHHDPPCPIQLHLPGEVAGWMAMSSRMWTRNWDGMALESNGKINLPDSYAHSRHSGWQLQSNFWKEQMSNRNHCAPQEKWKVKVDSSILFVWSSLSSRPKTAQTFRVTQRLSHEFPKLFLMLDELRDACQNLGFLGWGLRLLMIAVYSQPWQPDQFSWLKTDFNMTNQENNIIIYILHIS